MCTFCVVSNSVFRKSTGYRSNIRSNQVIMLCNVQFYKFPSIRSDCLSISDLAGRAVEQAISSVKTQESFSCICSSYSSYKINWVLLRTIFASGVVNGQKTSHKTLISVGPESPVLVPFDWTTTALWPIQEQTVVLKVTDGGTYLKKTRHQLSNWTQKPGIR